MLTQNEYEDAILVLADQLYRAKEELKTLRKQHNKPESRMHLKLGSVEYICKSANVIDFKTICNSCNSMGGFRIGPDHIKYC